MGRAGGRVATLTVLVLWVLAGPVGMAFWCSSAMCEGPCGTSWPLAHARGGAAVMPLVETIGLPETREPFGPALRVLDPPPKSLLSA